MGRYAGQGDMDYQPKELPKPVFDDKLAFAEFAAKLRIPTPSSQELPGELEESQGKVLVKARHSWRDGKLLPRGWVCQGKDDFAKALAEIGKNGHQADHYMLQEWLEIAPGDNFSVCGYHDAQEPRRNLAATVQRIASRNDGQSCSAVVAVVEDPAGLAGHTKNLLDGLGFTGPYELEFVRTVDGFKALELNPRFWLQHGLFLETGNGVVKRYLGLDSPGDWKPDALEKGAWVDSVWFWYNLVKGRMGIFRKLREAREAGHAPAKFFPNHWTAVRHLAGNLLSGRQPGE